MNHLRPMITALMLVAMMGLTQASLAQEEYIKEDFLDLEKIQEEEQLDESTIITQLYIFLAVRQGNSVEGYATRGDFDLDKDGFKVIEEPNDLEEYMSLPEKIEKKPKIKKGDDKYISFLTALPYYEELYKKENLKDPFQEGEIMEITTTPMIDYPNTFKGKRSIPILTSGGSNSGVERYIAFYNLGEITVKDKKEVVVTSFGIIKIKVEHPSE